MKYILLTIATIFSFVALSGFSSQERPQLNVCGEVMPQGTHYSIEILADWNTLTSPTSGNVSITLTDVTTGEKPTEIPQDVEPFVQCVKAAVGL